MTKKDQEVIIIPRRVSGQDKDTARRLTVMYALWAMLDSFKKQTEPVTWMKFGTDVEEFLECLETGRPHPVLDAWQKHKSEEAANRPAPSSRETLLRRNAVRACLALERAGAGKDQARKFMAEQLAAAKIFRNAPSAEALRNWLRDMQPPLAQPEDERVIENALKRAGADYKNVVGYFIGLMHATHNPATVMKVLPS